MDNLVVRLSRAEDLPILMAIYNEAVLNSVATFDTEPKDSAERRQWFNAHQDKRYPLLSAELKGEVVGWGSLSPFHPRPAYQSTAEFSVYVHRDYRALGIGKSLVAELLRHGGEIGFHSIIGLITGSNEASLKMAEQFGFRRAGLYREVGKKFNRWLDVVVVQLMLD